jgi:hypothetical protein
MICPILVLLLALLLRGLIETQTIKHTDIVWLDIRPTGHTKLYLFLLCCRFESFNSVIRQMNLSTNRQACSRDIGKMYAKHQILKYVINGGSWGDNHRYA